MNLFKNNPFKKLSFSWWKWNFRSIGCMFERATKGYCYRDVWDVDSHLVVLIPEMLKDLLRIHSGHPCTMTNGEWEDILREMINHFECAQAANPNYINPSEEEFTKLCTLFKDSEQKDEPPSEEEKAIRDNYFSYEKMASQLRNEHLRAGFALLIEHFNSLWD